MLSELDAQHEPGTFARASEDVIRQRKIVRARRGLQASVPPASDQPANPLANIQLMPTTVGPAAETGEPKATADANQNTVSEPAQKTEVTNEPQEEERTENNGKQEEDIEKPEKVGNKEPANKHQDAKPTVGFGGFGALASNPAGGLAFGLASGSNTMGFKGFSSLGRPRDLLHSFCF